jgi:hypothetical protein
MIFLFKLVCGFLIAGVTVCIDPGHGGSSSGAVGDYILEKDVVLGVALQVQNWLNQVPGISSAALTRDGDYDVSLQARTDYANSWGFNWFISIHENAFDTSVQGTETFCGSLSPEDPSYQLALPVQNGILDAYGYTDRGVKDGSYLHVIRETAMPAILGEGSFLDYDGQWNESYLYAFNVNDHVGLQSWAYANGICEHLGLEAPSYGNGVILIDNLSPGFAVDDSLEWEIVYSGAPWMMNCRTAEAAYERTASWTSLIPVNGLFTLSCWWTSGSDRSSSVCCRVFHSGGYSDVFVNQLTGGGEWVSLGSFVFDGECTVQILGSQSGAGVIVADAVKLMPLLGTGESGPEGLSVLQNPASSFTFMLPSEGAGEVLIYNSAGRRVESLSGLSPIEWTPVNLPNGVYFAVETGELYSARLIYIK